MEVANDNILFGMPSDPEMFLAALATVQDFAKQLPAQVRMGRKLSGWFLAAHIPNPELEFLKPCFPEEMAFLDEWEPRRGDWDYCYKFDAEAAYRLSIPTEQHVTAAFGIMVGADPAQLPDLSKVETSKLPVSWCGEDGGILLMDGAKELREILALHRPELAAEHKIVDVSWGQDRVIEGIYNGVRGFDVVAGLRSPATYIAACLGKTVLELYPDDRHMKWLSKWTGRYQMVYGNSFPVEYVWRALEGLLERYPICQNQTT